MKLLFTITLLLFSKSLIWAQLPARLIDSLEVSYQRPQDQNELRPPSIRDTAILQEKIQINVSLAIPNAEQVKKLEIWVTNNNPTEATKELRRFLLEVVKDSDGSYSLVLEKKKYPIINGKVIVSEKIQLQLLRQSLKLMVQATSLSGKLSEILSYNSNNQ